MKPAKKRALPKPKYDSQKILREARKRRTAGIQKEVTNLKLENETLKAKHQLQQVKLQTVQARAQINSGGSTSSGTKS